MKRTLLTLALIGAGVMGLGGGAAHVHAASPGATIANSVKACFNGGWQSQVDLAGHHFATQQSCVLYALTGASFGSVINGHFAFTNFSGNSNNGGIMLSGKGSFLGTCAQQLTGIPSLNTPQLLTQLPCAVKAGSNGPVAPLSSAVKGSGTWEMGGQGFAGVSPSVSGLSSTLPGGTWAYGPNVTANLGSTTFQTGEIGEGFVSQTGGTCHGASVRVVLILVALTLGAPTGTSASTQSGPLQTFPAVIGILQTPDGSGILFYSPGPQALLLPDRTSTFSMSC